MFRWLLPLGAAAIVAGGALYLAHPPLDLPDKRAFVCASAARAFMKSPESFRLAKWTTNSDYARLGLAQPARWLGHPWVSIDYYATNTFGASVLERATCVLSNEGQQQVIRMEIPGVSQDILNEFMVFINSPIYAMKYDSINKRTGPWKWVAWYKGTPAINIEAP